MLENQVFILRSAKVRLFLRFWFIKRERFFFEQKQLCFEQKNFSLLHLARFVLHIARFLLHNFSSPEEAVGIGRDSSSEEEKATAESLPMRPAVALER